MMEDRELVLVEENQIQNLIFTIRGKQVMMDSDLAVLYQVSTKRLNEQVTRNRNRFPEKFMFQLCEDEYNILRSQFATSRGKLTRRQKIYAICFH